MNTSATTSGGGGGGGGGGSDDSSVPEDDYDDGYSSTYDSDKEVDPITGDMTLCNLHGRLFPKWGRDLTDISCAALDESGQRRDRQMFLLSLDIEGCLYEERTNPRLILSLGDGWADWAAAVAALDPKFSVTVTDILPSRRCLPVYLEHPNLNVEREDINGIWSPRRAWRDFINLQNMLGDIMSYPDVFLKSFFYLRAGGWFKLTECSHVYTYLNGGTLDPNNAWYDVSVWAEQLQKHTGRQYDLDAARTVREMVDRGFTDISTNSRTIPVRGYLEMILDRIDALLRLGGAMRGIPDRQMTWYLEHMRARLILESDGVGMAYLRVYGRKPLIAQTTPYEWKVLPAAEASQAWKIRFADDAIADILRGTGDLQRYRDLCAHNEELATYFEACVVHRRVEKDLEVFNRPLSYYKELHRRDGFDVD